MDGISNEIIIKLLTYIFNVILNRRVFPEPWLIDIITPIYKNKGKKNDSSNYIGITLVSCFGKLFTAVINTRLLKFLDSKEILDEDQAGVRPGCSTTEHIFNLYMIAEHFISNGKNYIVLLLIMQRHLILHGGRECG